MSWNPPLGPTAMMLLVLAALAVAAGSYALSRKQISLADPQALAAMGLRAAAFLLLLLFVFQPQQLPEPETITAERTVGVLVDASGSMSEPASHADDPPTRLKEVRRVLGEHNVLEQIGKQAKLALYRFDGRPTRIKPKALGQLQAEGRRTDLAGTIGQTLQLHSDDDLAALLLFSDGRNTQGTDPRKIAADIEVPLFTFGVGVKPKEREKPEAPKKDLAVHSATSDPRIILGRSAQVAVTAGATGYGPRRVTVELLEGDSPINSTAVAVSAKQPRRQAVFTVTPDSVGTHEYRVRIPKEDDEADPTNNVRTVSVDVVDPVNRLLYVDRLRAERTHLTRVLRDRKNLRYTAVTQMAQDKQLVQGNDPQMKKQAATFSAEQLEGLKAVVLGDLPASALSEQQIAALTDWVDRGGALLLIAGPRSVGAEGFNNTSLAELLPFKLASDPKYLEEDPFKVKLTEEGRAHPAFQRVEGGWSRAPALLSRFEVEGLRPASTALMVTQETGEPIVAARNYGHGKAAAVLTDSTWRWQLGFEPSQAIQGKSPHRVFWNQLIDWLLPDLEQPDQQGEGRVQLISDRSEYEVGDDVVLMVNVRGPDGAVLRDAEVAVEVATPDGRPLSRNAQLESDRVGSQAPVYTAEFEAYAQGAYKVRATARQGGRTVGTDRVTVTASQPVVEFTETAPDHGLLRDLARASGGAFLEPGQLRELAMKIDMAPREIEVQPHSEADAEPAWNKWWLGLAFLALMGGEWFVRRRNRWV